MTWYCCSTKRPSSSAAGAAIPAARHYVYFWADGIHVQARLEDDAQCLLVIIGATPEGKKELVGLIDGVLCNFHAWGERKALLDRQAAACAAGPNWIAPGPSRSLMASNASISLSSLGSHLSNSETCA